MNELNNNLPTNDNKTTNLDTFKDKTNYIDKEIITPEETEKFIDSIFNSLSNDKINLLNKKYNIGIRLQTTSINDFLSKENNYGDYYVCKIILPDSIITREWIQNIRGFGIQPIYTQYLKEFIDKKPEDAYKKFLKKTFIYSFDHFFASHVDNFKEKKYKNILDTGFILLNSKYNHISERDVDNYGGTFGKRGKSNIEKGEILNTATLEKEELLSFIRNSKNNETLINKIKISFVRKIIDILNKLD